MKCPKCGKEMGYDYEGSVQWYQCFVGCGYKLYINPGTVRNKIDNVLLRYDLKTVETTHGNKVDYLFIDKYRLKVEDIYLVEYHSELIDMPDKPSPLIIPGDTARYSLCVRINDLEFAKRYAAESELAKARQLYSQIVSAIKELIKYE